MSETTTNPVTIVGTRVRVKNYGGFGEELGGYNGQTGTVVSVDDFVQVRLDSESHYPEDITLPCHPEELEVIEDAD